MRDLASPAAQAAALRLQLATIAGDEPESSFIEIRSGRNGRMAQQFVPVRALDRAIGAIRYRAQFGDVYVGAAPRVRESGKAEAVERVWCLWADCDSPESVEALRTFTPQPSIIVRSGSEDHLHAWWQLSASIAPSWAVVANRRLAYALGADPKVTDAPRVMRPIDSLNHKHKPPRLVECVRLELSVFTMGQVVGGLSDEPRQGGPRLPASRDRWGPRDRPEVLIQAVARKVTDAREGERNTMLNWAAHALGQHATAGTVSAEAARDALLDAALRAGLSESEAERTIRSGLEAGMAA